LHVLLLKAYNLKIPNAFVGAGLLLEGHRLCRWHQVICPALFFPTFFWHLLAIFMENEILEDDKPYITYYDLKISYFGVSWF
jgi:hypothetical protein